MELALRDRMGARQKKLGNGHGQRMATCHPSKPMTARGLCVTCYHYWRYHNDPAYRLRISRQNTASYQRYRAKRLAHARKKRAENPSLYKERKLISRYGLTLLQYSVLYQKQNGKCAICSRPLELANKKNVHLDHDHFTARNRGLLCAYCNHHLGWLEGDLRKLFIAVSYICKGVVS